MADLLEQVFDKRSQFVLVELLIGLEEVGLRPHHHAYLRGGRGKGDRGGGKAEWEGRVRREGEGGGGGGGGGGRNKT